MYDFVSLQRAGEAERLVPAESDQHDGLHNLHVAAAGHLRRQLPGEWWSAGAGAQLMPLQGRPFMESLVENKPLLYSVLAALAGIATMGLGVSPDLTARFELVELPAEVPLFP